MMSPVLAAYTIFFEAALSAVHCKAFWYAVAQTACSSAVCTPDEVV